MNSGLQFALKMYTEKNEKLLQLVFILRGWVASRFFMEKQKA
jgi:hypothetical protein